MLNLFDRFFKKKNCQKKYLKVLILLIESNRSKYKRENFFMFFNRNRHTSSVKDIDKKKPCARCSIIRLYLLSVVTLILIGIFAEDKVTYLQKVDKVTVVYIIFIFGAFLSVFKLFEWFQLSKNKK